MTASTRARTASLTATGCTELCSHIGTGCTTSRDASWRMISHEVEPAPTSTPARSATVEQRACRSSSSTSRRESMCGDSSSRGTVGDQAGEVDHPFDRGRVDGVPHDLGPHQVAAREAGTGQGVHEVDDGVDVDQRVADRFGGGDVAPGPFHVIDPS